MPEPTRPYIVDLIESLQRMDDRVVLRRDRVDTTAANLLGAVHRYARALDERGIGRGRPGGGIRAERNGATSADRPGHPAYTQRPIPPRHWHH